MKILSRFSLAEFLFHGVGVEIGVREGVYSSFLLTINKISKLYGVDINNTVDTLKNHPKFSFIKEESVKAATLFEDNFFDFIYIDADHSYKSCLSDMKAWWPKLKKYGIFAGHDYVPHQNGVIQAVKEFCSEKSIHFYITGPEDVDPDKYAAEMTHLLEYRKVLPSENDIVRQEIAKYPVPMNFEQFCPSWFFMKSEQEKEGCDV